jgi:glucan 1,3-beta-glucosidase
MWDCHFRVGGAKGSQLQLMDCPKLSRSINPNCKAASMLMYITRSAPGYFENVWAWTADHDIDQPPSAPGASDTGSSQVDIYSARGILIESQGPVWLYGTASEHNAFYQYQFSGANNIYSGHMQTETPYWQPTPNALGVFTPGALFNDPTFSDCGTDPTCVETWAFRVLNSTNVYIYGVGFYNFFDVCSMI